MYRCLQKPEIITVWTCPPTRYKYCVCTYTKDMNKAVCYNMDSFIYFYLPGDVSVMLVTINLS